MICLSPVQAVHELGVVRVRAVRRYFRDLRDMIAGDGELTPEARAEVMRHYATVPSQDYA
jgi:hypothetical protein